MNRQYSRQSQRQRPLSSRGGGMKRSRGGGDFNMLNALICFLDEGSGRAVYKARLLLKDDSRAPLTDEQGNEYTREQAAELVKQALLSGNGINIYFFENEDGSLSGNGRINVEGIEAAPAPVAKKQPAPRHYNDTGEDDYTFDEYALEEIKEQ